jgi:hypothetical protein
MRQAPAVWVIDSRALTHHGNVLGVSLSLNTAERYTLASLPDGNERAKHPHGGIEAHIAKV